MRRISLALFIALSAWVAWDLALPVHRDLRRFDGAAVGKLEAAMWQSYYEHRRLALFLQLGAAMREQFGAPWWRSQVLAWNAARAAVAFQRGRSREDYSRALPHLEQYFAKISALSDRPFDVRRAAREELEWWIIRREPERFTPTDWERLVAEVASVVYHVPASAAAPHAALRVQAMRLRDARGQGITEGDWRDIEGLLERSWTSLRDSVALDVAGTPSPGPE